MLDCVGGVAIVTSSADPEQAREELQELGAYAREWTHYPGMGLVSGTLHRAEVCGNSDRRATKNNTCVCRTWGGWVGGVGSGGGVARQCRRSRTDGNTCTE